MMREGGMQDGKGKASGGVAGCEDEEKKGAKKVANWNGRGRQALLMFEAGDHAYAGWVRISTQETFEAEKGRSNPPSDQRLGL